MLERHRLDMNQAEGRLMERDEHARIVSTMARIIVDEIDAITPT